VRTPATILVVANHATLRDTLAKSLRFAGYVALEADQVSVALQHLRAGAARVDGIISEAEMPGLSVCMLLRHAGEQQPPIPVLLVGDVIHEAAIARLVERGAVPMLEKPFGWEDLIGATRSLLAGGSPGLTNKRSSGS
jgi:DNA-binding NtrC family response regulator